MPPAHPARPRRWPWAIAAVIGWLWLAALTVLRVTGGDVRRHHFEPAGLLFGAGLVLLAWAASRGHAPRLDPPRRAGIVAGVPAIAGVVAFGWSAGLGPLSDDYVLRAWAIAGDWSPATWPFFRPLPLALWQAVSAAGGGWAALHVVNVLLHALNSALVGRLAATWLQAPWAGLAAGLLFALFPASTEAVAWTAGAFDLLAAASVMGAVTIATSSWRSPWREAGLLACCAAGLLSKETSVAAPAVLLVVTACAPADAATRRPLIRGLGIAAAAVVVFVALRMLTSPAVAQHARAWPDDRRAWKDLVLRPFAGVAVPFRTADGIGAHVYVAGFASLGLAALLVVRLARRPVSADGAPAAESAAATLIGLAWILASALPLLTQFFVSDTLEGSRYLYLPAAGAALLLAAPAAGPRVGWREGLALAGIGGLVVIGALRLHGERQIWLEAARVREGLLADAGRFVRQEGCGSLTVHDAPDNVRGAYVFREGLREALAAIAIPDGKACTARWTNGALVHRTPE